MGTYRFGFGRAGVAIALGVITAACVGSGNDEDTAAASPGTASATATAGNPVPADTGARTSALAAGDLKPPPEMPKDPSDAAALLEYAKDLDFRPDWSEPDDSDHCEGAGTCRLEIAPVSGVKNLGLGDYSGNGRIVARITNRGPGRDKNYNLQNGKSGYLHYRTVGGRTIATLYDTERGEHVAPHRDTPLTKSPSTGTAIGYAVRNCGHSRQRYPDRSWANFFGCDRQPHTIGPRGQPVITHSSPAWISCAEGCCSLIGP